MQSRRDATTVLAMTDHDETGDKGKAPEEANSESEPVEDASSESDAADEASSEREPVATPASDATDRREVRRSKPARSGKRAAREARERGAKAAAAPAGIKSSSALMFAVVALAAGGAAGWFGHVAQAKAMLRAESAPATAGSAAGSGPCNAWEKQICAGGGAESAACQQAKGAMELLTPSTCEAGLASMPATLAKVKAARVPCETLVGKLCADLPPGSKTCDMVKQRTPSFPGERCREMLTTYDAVLGELKMLDQQMGQGMGMPPGAMPPGAMPPGAEPPGHP
jgi:hypothetical protein